MVEIEPSLISGLLRQSLREGKAPYLGVISNSMSPLFLSGDRIRLSDAAVDSLIAGDVIVIQGSEELITHRYWGLADDGENVKLITKGDRPQHFDQPHGTDTLIGLVTARKRNDRVLDLSEGIGRRLNMIIAFLARFDSYLFSRAATDPLDTADVFYLRDGAYARTTRDNIGHRVLRRLIYLSARLFATMTRPFERRYEEN